MMTYPKYRALVETLVEEGKSTGETQSEAFFKTKRPGLPWVLITSGAFLVAFPGNFGGLGPRCRNPLPFPFPVSGALLRHQIL